MVRPSNVCLDAHSSGLGNNWAMGFGACADDDAVFQGVQPDAGVGQPLRYHDGLRMVRSDNTAAIGPYDKWAIWMEE